MLACLVERYCDHSCMLVFVSAIDCLERLVSDIIIIIIIIIMRLY